ncbi:MAG: class II glutamine amidotransferase [Gemmatimonadota bacterium]
MCRLVAYAGPKAELAPLLFGGQHSLRHQSWAPRELLSGSVNADGWGIVWFHRGQPLRIADERPIWQAGELEPLLRAQRSSVALSAVRNRTDGVPGGAVGTPPLLRGGCGFVLNGFLAGYRERLLRPLLHRLSDPTLSLLEGATDSELVFLNVLERIRAGETAPDALAATATWVLHLARDHGLDAQLNCALATADGVALTRASSRGASNSLYLGRASPLVPRDGTLAASEPLDDGATWDPVPEGSLVTLDPAGGSRITPLPAGP